MLFKDILKVSFLILLKFHFTITIIVIFCRAPQPNCWWWWRYQVVFCQCKSRKESIMRKLSISKESFRYSSWWFMMRTIKISSFSLSLLLLLLCSKKQSHEREFRWGGSLLMTSKNEYCQHQIKYMCNNKSSSNDDAIMSSWECHEFTKRFIALN